MPDVHGYSQLTTGTVPAASWEVAWNTLQSWKGLMQSFPGLNGVRIEARALDGGAVRLATSAVFETLEQLEEWAATPYTPATALTGLPQPVPDLQVEAFEVLT